MPKIKMEPSFLDAFGLSKTELHKAILDFKARYGKPPKWIRLRQPDLEIMGVKVCVVPEKWDYREKKWRVPRDTKIFATNENPEDYTINDYYD